MNQRFATKDIVSFVSQTPLFRGCKPDTLYEMVQGAEQNKYESGATILPPGLPVSGLGLLLRGRAGLMLVDATSGAQTRFEQLLPGNFFGEVGLLLGRGNPLAVVAEEDCYTLMIEKNRMERVFRNSAEVCLSLAKRISASFAKASVLGMRSNSMAPPDREAQSMSEKSSSEASTASSREGEIIWVEIGKYNLTADIIGMIPTQLMRKHRILPLELRDKKLVVGMVNPRSIEALEELGRVMHTVDPEIVAVSSDEFNQTFVRLKLDSGEEKAQRTSSGRNVLITYEVDKEKEADKGQLFIEGEVTGLFDRILAEAIEMGASDIHIEPESTGVKIRYRVQGTLIDRKEFLSLGYATPLIARIKVLSELDITERRLPQDGRITAQIGRQDLNLRVSTMAVARGEKAVIRIIDSSNAMRPLHQIFPNSDLEKAVRTAIAELYGAIVVAGPTGSGKSSTLYSMLNERRLGRPDNNIVTVEDPVEFLLQGITQVPVSPKAKFGFAQALHGLLRQDPDVIMIGELRDAATTTIMVESALTGHLVLTSIHGNHSTAVIQRLLHLGTNPVLLSQALSIVIVQRLAQRLCPNCVIESNVAPALIDNLMARNIISRAGTTKLPRPVGCDACNNTGYLGRIAVHEVMNFDDGIRAALAGGATPEELIEKAKERKRFFSFATAGAYLMARRMIAPSDALLLVAD